MPPDPTIQDWLELDTDSLADPLPHRTPENRGKYSLLRAVRLANPSRRGKVDGLEGEVSAEIARRCGRRAKGFFVPLDAEVRALSTTTGLGGIPTIVATRWIDVLRQRSLVLAMGATLRTDLTGGKFSYPVKASTATTGWLDEAAVAPNSAPAVSQSITFTPRTVGAYTDITRKAIDVIPDAEAQLVEDLTRSIGVELDRVALNGRGINFEPLGIMQNSGASQAPFGVNGLAPTRALIVAMLQKLGNSNADIPGALGWVTSPNGRAALQLADNGGATVTGKYLWTNRNEVLGLPAGATTNVPNNLAKGSGTNLTALILGNWEDMIIGSWGAVDVLFNQFLVSSQGIYRLTALLDADVNVRHPESFVVAPDVVTP